jgi:NitT/TauT family transport system substrate-binding protein
MSGILRKIVFCGLMALASPAGAAEQVNVATPVHGLVELPIVAAMRNRYFATEGLEIQKIQITPEIAIKALLDAEVDFNLAWDASVGAAISGAPIKVVAATAGRPFDVLIARPEIGSGKDLRGKSLGVVGFSGSADYLAWVAVRYLGLETDRDIRIVETGNGARRLDKLRQGSIQAALVDVATAARAEDEGFRILARLGDIIDLPVFGIAVTTKKLAAEREQIKRFIRATLRGMHFLKQNRKDAIAIIQRYLSMNPTQAGRTYDAAVGGFADYGLISDRALALSISRAREDLPGAREPKLSQVADWSLVREILADRRKLPFWLKPYDS